MIESGLSSQISMSLGLVLLASVTQSKPSGFIGDFGSQKVSVEDEDKSCDSVLDVHLYS